jgi:hypothetical protein
MNSCSRLFLTGMLALAAEAAVAQVPNPYGQPQLSPYLYLNRGGQQGYLQYRQALDQQQFQQQAAPYVPPLAAAPQNRITNYQANPQTTGFAPNTQTGHADERGAAFNFQNYSHYYNIRTNPARPY